MFENFKFGLFVKILSFLVCIFLIPLLVCGYLLTQYTMSSYKEEVLSLNFNTTNFIQQMIDENLEDIDVVQLLISQNKEIMDFVDSSLNYDDKAYYAKCVSDEINKYRLYKNSISEIHLYSKSSGCIVTRNSYYDIEEYYNTFLLDSEFSKEKWKEILSTPNNNQELIKIKSSISNSTTAAVVLPSIRDSKGNFATLLIVLNENYIVNTFNQLIPDQSNSYFVITSEDEVLIKSKELPFEINVAERFSNKYDKPSFYGGYVIFSSCSANEKMNYISIVSEDEILGGVQLNNKILMICIMFMALILILLAFVFSNKTFTPIRNLAILGIGEKKYSLFCNIKWRMAHRISASGKFTRFTRRNKQ